MESYIKVKNILSRDICKIVERYALYDIYNDKHEDSYVIGSHSKYADSLMESHVLPDHTDRPSCEISITIPIGFKYNGKSDDYLWPLHVYINEEKRYIPCDIGDGLIYKGCELKHGRETFDVDKGSYQIQMFLHYVDANGPYAEKYKYDGRDSIGIKKRKSNGIFLIS